jgi:hypothetical protein
MRLVGRSDRRALLYAELSAFQGLTSDLTKHVDAIGTAFKEWSDFTDNLRVHLGDELGVDPTEDLSNDDLKLAQDIFERAEQKLDKAQAQYQDQDRKLTELLTREIPRVCSPAEILEKLSEIIPQDSDSTFASFTPCHEQSLNLSSNGPALEESGELSGVARSAPRGRSTID